MLLRLSIAASLFLALAIPQQVCQPHHLRLHGDRRCERVVHDKRRSYRAPRLLFLGIAAEHGVADGGGQRRIAHRELRRPEAQFLQQSCRSRRGPGLCHLRPRSGKHVVCHVGDPGPCSQFGRACLRVQCGASCAHRRGVAVQPEDIRGGRLQHGGALGVPVDLHPRPTPTHRRLGNPDVRPDRLHPRAQLDRHLLGDRGRGDDPGAAGPARAIRRP